MTDDTRDHDGFWYRGKTTRRRVLGYGASAGALGAAMLVPAPWQAAFGQAKPYKVGSLQPLSGVLHQLDAHFGDFHSRSPSLLDQQVPRTT